MEVLKDAASAAIYGAEAGNGVVLITTKKGKSGRGTISYDFQLSTQHLGKTPKLLNAQEYITYMKEGGLLTDTSLDAYWDGKTDTDWVGETFETGLIQKHTLNFKGGNEQGNYYLSLGAFDNDGIMKGKNDQYKRYTATINAEYNIKKWIKVGTTNNISNSKYRISEVVGLTGSMVSVTADVLYMDPLTPVYYENTPSDFALNAQNQGHVLAKNEDGRYYGVTPFVTCAINPLMRIDATAKETNTLNINGSVYANITPFKDLTFTSRFGYNMIGKDYKAVDTPYFGNANGFVDYLNLSTTDSNTLYYQWENFVNYNHTWAKAHTLTAMAGTSFQQNVYRYTTGTLTGNGEDAVMQNKESFYHLNYANASATRTVAGETTTTAKLSYFGRVSYDYKGRYMLQGTLRADAADLSMLPKSGRWGFFPAVSAGWSISEESWFSSLKENVDMLKLRASWGQNGSLSSLGNYAYSNSIIYGTVYPMLNASNPYVTSAYPNSLGNEDLTWETSEQTNIGLDARFLRNRLSFNVDWFIKKTKDLLVEGTTPSLEIGGTASPINAGNVENKGWEFELGWQDKVKDFSYSVRANLATLSNKVTYLDPSLSRLKGMTFHNVPITYFEKGYPVYYFRGYEFTGVDKETGNPTFADLDGNGEISDGDLTDIGNAIPDFTYGLTITAAYKGFDLSVFGTGSYGNKIYNCISKPDYPTANQLKEVYYEGRWIAGQDNSGATVPRANAANMDKYSTSSALVYDGSYFKIKQMQLGYTLPKRLQAKAHLSNLRLYCSLEDFFTFTDYPGFDPEVSATATSGMGVDMASYPSAKKIVFGLNIEF